MLGRATVRTARTSIPRRQKQAQAAKAAPARDPAAASKLLDNVLNDYYAKQKSRTVVFSLKPTDKQAKKQAEYPANIPDPSMRNFLGEISYGGPSEKLLNSSFSFQFYANKNNQVDVEAVFQKSGSGTVKSGLLKPNVDPSVLPPAQLFEYYKVTSKIGLGEGVSTADSYRVGQYPNLSEALKHVFSGNFEFSSRSAPGKRLKLDDIVNKGALEELSFYSPSDWFPPVKLKEQK